jgi:hypothetical protein
MNKEFVTYEQALALKELGFDKDCLGYYVGKDKEVYISNEDIQPPFKPDLDSKIMFRSPLYSQAFRWFRDKHNLYSEIKLDSYKEPYSLKVTIKHLDDTNTFVDKEYYPYSNGIGDIDNKKYEEAESACLDVLIEITKNK